MGHIHTCRQNTLHIHKVIKLKEKKKHIFILVKQADVAGCCRSDFLYLYSHGSDAALFCAYCDPICSPQQFPESAPAHTQHTPNNIKREGELL